MKTIQKNALVSLEAATELVRSGAALSLAGPEAVLDRLPLGNWIGGTSSYFMAEHGGVRSVDHVFVTFLPEESEVRFAFYEARSLQTIMCDAPDNGFSMAIIPAGSEALRRFSEGSRYWSDILLKPVVGWIAGIDLALLGKQSAKIYNGRDGSKHTDGAVVARVSLPAGRIASLETVNIFERDPGAILRFSEITSEATTCRIDGHTVQLADYLMRHGNADGKRPLIGDFAGASINVSVQAIDSVSGRVSFYAPVFPDVDYYLAKPIYNYEVRFAYELARRAGKHVVFSCNCILNYLYGGLEGKRTGAMQGPVTFGEIAYLLHNQTLVLLTIT